LRIEKKNKKNIMAKDLITSHSIYNLPKVLSEGNFQPIFFLFGEDSFTISNAIKEISKAVETEIASEFDKQVIDANKETKVSSIIDEASAFPFGGNKKLVVVKNFENVNDKKQFVSYIQNPAEFCSLIISQAGKKADLKKEPFKSLAEKGYLFIAQELKGTELINWIIRECSKLGIKINQDNAWGLVDLIGENKGLIEMNLLKFSNYLQPGDEISPETIEKLTSLTKEYNIFNLQDAIGRGDKTKSIEIAFNLIKNGNEPIYIVTMLTKFVNTIARALELSQKKISEYNASKEANVSYFYYKNCLKATYLRNFRQLHKAAESLLWADKTIKTTSIDSKTVITILISRILN
jgi:DNA polymerase-3 subunit delta